MTVHDLLTLLKTAASTDEVFINDEPLAGVEITGDVVLLWDKDHWENEAVSECHACLGHGHVAADGDGPSSDSRDPKCLDCRGSGKRR